MCVESIPIQDEAEIDRLDHSESLCVIQDANIKAPFDAPYQVMHMAFIPISKSNVRASLCPWNWIVFP